MTSKTSSVSFWNQLGGVFQWKLRRCMPLMTAYGTLLFVGYLAIGITASFDWAGAEITANLLTAMPGTILMSLLLAAYQFGYLYSKRQIDLYHAVPVSRDALFWGSYLSGFVCIAAPLLPAYLADLLIAVLMGRFTPALLLFLVVSLGLLLLMGAMNLAFFSLAAVISGSYLEYGVNSIMLTFCWPLLVHSLYNLAVTTIPGIPETGGAWGYDLFVAGAGSPPCAAFFTFLPMNINYMDKTVLETASASPYPGVPLWSYLWWALFTAALLCLTVYGYRRRKSETAKSSPVYAILQYGLRILTGAAFGVLAAYAASKVSYSSIWVLLVAAAAVLFLFLLTESLYYKTLRNAVRHLPCFGVSLLLLAAAIVSISLGLGMDTAVPEDTVGVDVAYRNSIGESGVSVIENLEGGGDLQSEPTTVLTVLIAGVTSPENLEKAELLQAKLVEFERARKYPYLPSRGSVGSVDNFYLNYLTKAYEPVQKYYSIERDALSENALRLYEECVALADEITRSEEYVKGLVPVTAIDAAGRITKTTSVSGRYDDTGASGEERDTRILADLSGEKTFREQLEAALIDDLTHGRYPDQDTQWEEEQNDLVGTYQIWYQRGAVFTARGGLQGPISAAGKKYRLDDTWPEEGDISFRVFPEMTATTALLDSLFS